MRLFIFGAGFSGRAIARRMIGEAETIVGTTRSTEKFGLLRASGIDPVVFDGQLDARATEALEASTHLVVSVAPGAGDPVLQAVGDVLRDRMKNLVWIGYLSTIGVYGDHDGDWVDEETPPDPVSRRSIERVAAEAEWLALGQSIGVPVAVLRLSGIYGPGRNAFLNLKNGKARRIIKPGQVFNRIFVEDIAGAAAHLAAGKTGGVFNVTDDLPAPPQDVIAHAAQLMGVEPPPEIPFEEAEMTPMARSFWGETKRVSNRRIRATGYEFVCPDYHSALARMWEAGNWQAEPGA